MNKQEFYRCEYKKVKPQWQDSLTIYRQLIKSNLQPGSKVLDIGCGHSDFLQDIFTDNIETYGLDPDEQALARNSLIKNKVVGQADKLPFADNFFDIVIMAWVLEHIADPLIVFQEIQRVLKPGGKLIFLTPNAWNYNIWLIRLVPSLFHDFFTRKLYGRQENDTYPKFYRANSAAVINRLVKEAGLEKVNLIFNGDPSYISFNKILFALARGLEKIMDIRNLQKMRVHLIGEYKK